MAYELVRVSETHGVARISGDDLWMDGEAGWYHGPLVEDPDDKDEVVLGDTVGPFDTREDAENDLRGQV